jgi:hypothetical protein
MYNGHRDDCVELGEHSVTASKGTDVCIEEVLLDSHRLAQAHEARFVS